MMENVKNYPLTVPIWNGTSLTIKIINSKLITVKLVSLPILIQMELLEKPYKENKIIDPDNIAI